MIRISGNPISPESIIEGYPPGAIQRSTLTIMANSSRAYSYESLSQLTFELDLRSHIINASRALYRSNLHFRTFRKSFCNERYWTRTEEGGFLLKEYALPSDALQDIFVNGNSYGTECATAIVIIFYKAVLNQFKKDLFNKMFSNLQLMDWHYIDNDLDIGYYDDVADSLPGDCKYFKNPDVNPLTPEWQGENAILLEQNVFYGHGIGIKTGAEIIAALNTHRTEGSDRSAYLLNSATRPGFKTLANKYYNYYNNTQRKFIPHLMGYHKTLQVTPPLYGA